MGLGLAISRRLIELHGGTIGVASSGQEGHGSVFHFTVPILSEDLRREPSPEARARKTLLLARQGSTTHVLKQHLEERGLPVDVLEPQQLDHWLAYVVASRPTAILMDSELVTERGWAIIKALKAQPSTRHTPVVLYSLPSRASAGSVLQVDYVAKNEVASELVQALDRYGLVDGSPPESRTILVVEDEPVLLDAYASMVAAHLPRCHVLRAEDGEEAIDAIRRCQPDLILLDLLMPRMSGFEVLEAMRALETTRNIPVIVLTGQTLTETDIARLNHGVGAVLSKGVFSTEETIARIEAVLAGSDGLGSEAQRFVRQAVAYMHTHYAEPISSTHIADHLSVHQNHLSRCFRQEFGVAPMTFLRRWRVRQAQRLLETTDQSVTDVALGTGFSSQSYFSRVFKEEIGLSPTAYRRECRHGGHGPLYAD
jgi:CheY-like chemotaxis protein